MVASVLANPLINSCYLTVPKRIYASIKHIGGRCCSRWMCLPSGVLFVGVLFHLGILNYHVTCTKQFLLLAHFMQCSGTLINTAGFFPHSSPYSLSHTFLLGLISQPLLRWVISFTPVALLTWVKEIAISLNELQSHSYLSPFSKAFFFPFLTLKCHNGI